MSRAFSSPDVAFVSYISVNFIFGLCTMLMTTMPRLLAIVSRAQVSGPRLASRGLQQEGRDRASLLLFQLKWDGNVLVVSTILNLPKDKLTLVNKNLCAIMRAMPRLVAADKEVQFLSLHGRVHCRPVCW